MMSDRSASPLPLYEGRTKAAMKAISMIESATRQATLDLQLKMGEAAAVMEEIISNTQKHSHTALDVALQVDEAAADAVAAGYALISGCEALDREMESAEVIARTVKGIRKALEVLEVEVGQLVDPTKR
uniref:BLOC-1-related complex subunit 6 C-terminal helix domain-containing protein n=1 Tax=Palpitomonas bilix TaxID=652834 RepID=A0A7S3G8C2_9EUKA|mmetsp:Transcript_38461/g.98952  ORF Transcript_38461/g.98952 Transcript_38461/m.98952 type:complete len:129 (+) Transcript_38461:98-484(+)